LLLGEVEEREIIPTVDNVFSKLDSLVPDIRQSSVAPASPTLAWFADFVTLQNAGLALALTGVILAVRYFLASEKQELQGRVNNSTQIVPENFVRSSTVKPTGEPFKSTTYTLEQAVSAIQKNIGLISDLKGGAARCLRVGVDLFLCNHHVLERCCPNFRLDFEGVSYHGTVTGDVAVQLGLSDVALLKVAGVPAAPTALPYVWPNVDQSYTTFDEVYMVREGDILKVKSSVIFNETFCGYKSLALDSNLFTRDGDCGYPMIGISGGKARIVAIHHSQLTGVTERA